MVEHVGIACRAVSLVVKNEHVSKLAFYPRPVVSVPVDELRLESCLSGKGAARIVNGTANVEAG